MMSKSSNLPAFKSEFPRLFDSSDLENEAPSSNPVDLAAKSSKKEVRLTSEEPQSCDFWSGMYCQKELWTCLYCGEKFIIKASLKTHANEHQNEKNYSLSQNCVDCGIHFPTFSEYCSHLETTGHMKESALKPNHSKKNRNEKEVPEKPSHLKVQQPNQQQQMVQQPLQQQKYLQQQQVQLQQSLKSSRDSQSSARTAGSTDSSKASLNYQQTSQQSVPKISLPAPPYSHSVPHQGTTISPRYYIQAPNSITPYGSPRNEMSQQMPHSQHMSQYMQPQHHLSSPVAPIGHAYTPMSSKSVQAPSPMSIIYFAGIKHSEYSIGAYAWMVVNENDKIISHGSYPVEKSGSNIVDLEYEGLLHGIQEAQANGIRRAVLKSTNEFILNQLTHGFRGIFSTHEMNTTAVSLLKRFEKVEFQLISGDKNYHVSQLASNCLANIDPPKKSSQNQTAGMPQKSSSANMYPNLSLNLRSNIHSDATSAFNTKSFDMFSPGYGVDLAKITLDTTQPPSPVSDKTSMVSSSYDTLDNSLLSSPNGSPFRYPQPNVSQHSAVTFSANSSNREPTTSITGTSNSNAHSIWGSFVN